MNTRNHFYTNLVLGAFLFTFSQLAWSLGLGEAQVDSFLGEPLEVKIELITRPGDDLASISASLASAEDYQMIGASRDDISVPLQFTIYGIDSGSGGNAYIAVASNLAVSNPVVRLILEVNWSSGRMLREYTLFLDPPTYRQPAPAPRTEVEEMTEVQPADAPPVEIQSTAEEQPSQLSQPSSGTTTSSESVNRDDAIISGGDEYGPVQSGDTLWRIAKDWSAGSGLSLNKVMLAIQRENPQAFSRNNINLLQRGAILRMPGRDDVNSISSASASSEVTKQVDAFQLHKTTTLADSDVPLLSSESASIGPDHGLQASVQPDEHLTQIEEVSAEPLIEEGATSETATEDDLLSAETPAESATSQLELLPPSADSLNSTTGFDDSEAATGDVASAQALREELSRKEEELINQQQQNEYLEQRLQELENQLAQSREGTVKDENLASMEERLRAERLSDEQAAVPQIVSAPQSQDEPWYKRFSLWLLSVLVLVAVAAGWLMSRRGGPDTVTSDLGSGDEALRKLKDEAKDEVRKVDSTSSEKVLAEQVTPKNDADEASEAESESTGADEPEVVQSKPSGKNLIEEEDAQVLDEESADPEIQLDLARAYISMGDREAARVILEEVIANGSEEQQAEANSMKDLL
jgi:pilus assembly protein FimV